MRLIPLFCIGAALLLASFSALPQNPDLMPPPHPEMETRDRKLPNGKSQNDEILKAEYAKSLQDAQRLVELSESLQADMGKESPHVLSLSDIKKTEEIEKIARRIRGRIRRF